MMYFFHKHYPQKYWLYMSTHIHINSCEIFIIFCTEYKRLNAIFFLKKVVCWLPVNVLEKLVCRTYEFLFGFWDKHDNINQITSLIYIMEYILLNNKVLFKGQCRWLEEKCFGFSKIFFSLISFMKSMVCVCSYIVAICKTMYLLH